MSDDTILTLQFMQTQEFEGTIFHHELGVAIEKLRCNGAKAMSDEWQPIETAPVGDDDFYLVCSVNDDRSAFVVRGSIFATARKHPPEHHLSLAYLTHWRPLPDKPRAALEQKP